MCAGVFGRLKIQSTTRGNCGETAKAWHNPRHYRPYSAFAGSPMILCRGSRLTEGRRTMKSRILACSVLSVFCLAMAGGCVNYAYDVTPTGVATFRVPADRFAPIPQGPVDYRFRTIDNHLVVQVWNATHDPVRIVAEKSVVVDPYGRSHGIRPMVIAPGSFVRFIVPPVLRTVAEPGWTVGVGFGVGGGFGHYHHGRFYGGGFYDPFWFDEPRYVTVVEGEQAYWEWDGADGEARLILVIEHQGHQFTQELRITRSRI